MDSEDLIYHLLDRYRPDAVRAGRRFFGEVVQEILHDLGSVPDAAAQTEAEITERVRAEHTSGISLERLTAALNDTGSEPGIDLSSDPDPTQDGWYAEGPLPEPYADLRPLYAADMAVRLDETLNLPLVGQPPLSEDWLKVETETDESQRLWEEIGAAQAAIPTVTRNAEGLALDPKKYQVVKAAKSPGKWALGTYKESATGRRIFTFLPGVFETKIGAWNAYGFEGMIDEPDSFLLVQPELLTRVGKYIGATKKSRELAAVAQKQAAQALPKVPSGGPQKKARGKRTSQIFERGIGLLTYENGDQAFRAQMARGDGPQRHQIFFFTAETRDSQLAAARALWQQWDAAVPLKKDDRTVAKPSHYDGIPAAEIARLEAIEDERIDAEIEAEAESDRQALLRRQAEIAASIAAFDTLVEKDLTFDRPGMIDALLNGGNEGFARWAAALAQKQAQSESRYNLVKHLSTAEGNRERIVLSNRLNRIRLRLAYAQRNAA